MAKFDVIMPQMGESIAEGTLVKWLKKIGETIERDQPLFEISTDKVDAEIPSPASGTLLEIKIEEGKTVPINTIVAVLETDVAAPQDAPATETPPAEAPAPAAARQEAASIAQRDGDEGRQPPTLPQSTLESFPTVLG